MIGSETGLSLAFDLLRDKKVNLEKASDLWSKVRTGHGVLLADSQYNIIHFLNEVLDRTDLPIVEYNLRRVKERKVERFKAEIHSLMDFEWLSEKYKERSPIERSFNTVKTDLRTKEFRVRGYKRVKSHYGLHPPPSAGLCPSRRREGRTGH